jgi:peptidoglycan/LPS O-acetylase OafA/YrhL
MAVSIRAAQPSHVAAFDGTRGVAISLVVVHHAFPTSSFRGEIGVDIFFVLSGYLITRLLLAERDLDYGIRLRRFYLRRLLRLYPALLAMLVCLLPLGAVITPSFDRYLIDSAEAATYLTNLVQTWTGGGTGPLAHLWSLAEEEQFYLVWPPILTLLLWRRLGGRAIVRGLVMASAASFVVFATSTAGPHEVGRDPIARAGGLALGAAVALLVHYRAVRTVHRSIVAMSTALLCAVVIAGSTGALDRSLVVPLATVAVAPIIAHLATAAEGAFVATVTVRPLVFLGTVSYSLYLWHYPLFTLLLSTLHWSSPQVACFGIPAAVTIAAASRRWVELPMLRLRDRSRTSRVTPAVPAQICRE